MGIRRPQRGPQSAQLRAALYYARKRRLRRLVASSGGSVDPLRSSVEFYADFADWAAGPKTAYGQAAMTIREENTAAYSAKGSRAASTATGPYIESSDAGFWVGGSDFTLELFGVELVSHRNNTIFFTLGYRDTGLRCITILSTASNDTLTIQRATTPTGSGINSNDVTGLGLQLDTPYDITLERFGDDYTLYVDGVSEGTFTSSAVTFSPTNAQFLTFGYEILANGSSRSGNDLYLRGIRHTVGTARFQGAHTVPTFPIPAGDIPSVASTLV